MTTTDKAPQAEEQETRETPGHMLLCFIVGLGLCFIGLLFVLTGIGMPIGIGMIALGGLICLVGSLITVFEEWATRRKGRS